MSKAVRRICQHCGAKRNISELEAVAGKKGKYFQANKEIVLYVCRQARRFINGYQFAYCNGKQEPPEITRY